METITNRLKPKAGPSPIVSPTGRAEPSHAQSRDEQLEGLAALPYHTRMSHFVRGSTRHRVAGDITVLDFRPLYTVAVHDLQRRLATEIQKIGKSDVTDQQLEDIGDTLHKYTNALRDFEFIHANRWDTHFVKDIAASRLDSGPGSRIQKALITDLGLDAPASHRSLFRDTDVLGSFNPSLMQHSTALGDSLGTGRLQELASQRRRAQIKETVQRFGFAISGGLIIVVPMLILVVGSATATPRALGVVSASILVFALAVALFADMKPENLLAATAAYAAVLVTLMGNGR